MQKEMYKQNNTSSGNQYANSKFSTLRSKIACKPKIAQNPNQKKEMQRPKNTEPQSDLQLRTNAAIIEMVKQQWEIRRNRDDLVITLKNEFQLLRNEMEPEAFKQMLINLDLTENDLKRYDLKSHDTNDNNNDINRTKSLLQQLLLLQNRV